MSLLKTGTLAPSAQEIAARPELVKAMLTKVIECIYDHDLEHALVIGLTPTGDLKLYHTYGEKLSNNEVAALLRDIAKLAEGEL